MKVKQTDVGVLVFARMNSTRLPGKAMKTIEGYPLIERVIRRAKISGYNVMLATSKDTKDDVLGAVAQKIDIPCFRGSEENVLQRAVLAAEKAGFQAFARLCGDRPLFSVEEMKFALAEWQKADENKKPDLITNNYPTKCVRGLTTEVVNTQTLRKQLDNQPDAELQEHLTTGFYRHPDNYRIISLTPRYQKWRNHSGFAVDTIEDYHIINEYINQHPDLNHELD